MFEHIPQELKMAVTVLSVLFITMIIAIAFKYFLTKALAKYLKYHPANETVVLFLPRLSSAVIYLIGICVALTHIPEFKAFGQSLLAGAGIITVIGGLASQQILSNIFSGFVVVFFRPFKLGDKITLNSSWTGVVEDITLRETILRDFENNRIVVPNSLITSQVLVNANHTDDRICKLIDIGIGYSSDTDLAMAIIPEEIIKHPLHIDNRTAEQIKEGQPVAPVRIIGLGNSSVNLRAWAWASCPYDGFVMQCDLLKSIKNKFDSQGIEIPFPQTTLSFA